MVVKRYGTVLELLIGVTTVAALLAGGALFAFSAFVMPALRSVDAHTAITSMQAINVEAPRSALMLPLVGSALAALVTGLWVSIARPAGWALPLAGCVGVVAAFAVTAIYHVPHNDAFASIDPADATSWSSYEAGWTAWNHVRVGLYLVSAIALAVAAVLPAADSADAAQ